MTCGKKIKKFNEFKLNTFWEFAKENEYIIDFERDGVIDLYHLRFYKGTRTIRAWRTNKETGEERRCSFDLEELKAIVDLMEYLGW